MELIKEKYTRIRSKIENGDVILFRGNHLLSKIIQESDSDAYYNHVGIVLKISDALFIIDSNANGVEPARLSERIDKYVDFKVLRSKKTVEQINESLKFVLKKQDSSKIKYDYWNGFKAMLNRKFNFNLKIKIKNNRNICSMFVLPYAYDLDIVSMPESMDDLFFPQDFIRYGKNYISF